VDDRFSSPSFGVGIDGINHRKSMKQESHKRQTRSRVVRVGVDTGGTFTDFVYEADGRLQIFKLASTPGDPSLAIINGLRRITQLTNSKLSNLEVVHGTTVGTNALLQRKGARTALITTSGFEDVLAIGRQARPELYNLDAVRPPPLVADGLRFGVRERVSAQGEILVHLAEAEIAKVSQRIRRSGVESVAISLLFSFVRPEHEQRLAGALALLGIPLSISQQILPEYREYERTSTVVINAYLQPLMGLPRSAHQAKSEVQSPKSKVQGSKIRVRFASHAVFRRQYLGRGRSRGTSANYSVRTVGRHRRRFASGTSSRVSKDHYLRYGRYFN
jgi:N-methylhydantoinase A